MPPDHDVLQPDLTPRRPPRRRRRLALVYAGLVVVPAGIAAVLLVLGGSARSAGSSAATSPLDNMLPRTLLSVAVVVGLCRLAGLLAPRLGQPPVVAEIATGIALGPSALGALWPQASHWVVPPQVIPALNVLAQLGVVLFVFLTGLELDVVRLRGRAR